MKTLLTFSFFIFTLLSYSQTDEKIDFVNPRNIEIQKSEINRGYWFVTDRFNYGNELGSYIFSLNNGFILSKWVKLSGCPMEKEEYLSGISAIYSN